jgi:hypothetical protein
VLGWLDRFLRSVRSHLPGAITDVIQATIGGIAGLFGSITSDVSDAWDKLLANVQALDHSTGSWVRAVTGQLTSVITHLIPRYAMTAWWWVTNPGKLAEALIFYIALQAERYAWTLGKYLGQFALALVLHHARQFVHLIEDIVTAVL